MHKLVSIEWLRGIAAFGVCEMHVFCALDFFSKSDTFFQKYIFPISIAGRVGVSVFFVISGFIIPYSMQKNKYTLQRFTFFILRRLARLEPPYLLSIALVVLIMAATATLKNMPFKIDWQLILLHLGYLNVFFSKPWLSGVYWSLAIEFQYYILIALLFPVFFYKTPVVRTAAFFSSLGLSVFLSFYISEAFIFVHFPLFLLGVACCLEKLGYISKPFFIFKIVVCLGVVFFLHHKANAFFAMLAVLAIFFDVDIKFRPAYFFGKISYSLYLFHWSIGIELLRNVYLYYYPASSEMHKIAFCFASLAVCVAFAALMYEVIEKPALNLSKRIKYF